MAIEPFLPEYWTFSWGEDSGHVREKKVEQPLAGVLSRSAAGRSHTWIAFEVVSGIHVSDRIKCSVPSQGGENRAKIRNLSCAADATEVDFPYLAAWLIWLKMSATRART